MNGKEKKLFWELCRPFADDNQSQICAYIRQGAASPALLGHLFWNRMAGVACHTLQKSGGMPFLNREFRTALQEQMKNNIQKNHSYDQCLQYLSEILSPSKSQYAMLKGAILCAAYPQGCRTASDVDLLVPAESVSAVGMLLEKAGFVQGYIRGDQFYPANRKEIIYSRMMRGETVPYIKEVRLPGMRYLEVDINFSLDYKNGSDALVQEIIEHTQTVQQNGISIQTLDKIHFLIHLCQHLYKEATTLPWIQMQRDMTLYKYLDICMLIEKLSPLEEAALIRECHTLHMCVPCYYAIFCTGALLGNGHAVFSRLANALCPNDTTCLHMVRDPEGKRNLIYQKTDIVQRFWAKDRQVLLQEIQKG